MAELTLKESDGGRSFTIQQCERVVIRLEENPTTGYRWAIDEIAGDALELEGDSFELPEDSGLGGGGRRTFRFRAVSPGTSRIQLKYWRSWEGERSIEKRFSATVEVVT